MKTANLTNRFLGILLMTVLIFTFVINPALAEISTEDLAHAQDVLKQDKQNYENRSNELKNNFKGKNVDLTNVNNLMIQWSELLKNMENTLNSSTDDLTAFWDLNSDEDSFSGDVGDAFQTAYDLSNLEDQKDQALKEKPRQIKDIERQLKDLKRNSKKAPVDTTVLDGYLAQLQSLITQMQAVANGTVTDAGDATDSIRDFVSDFDSISQDFYNTINDLNETVNAQNQLENSKRNLKDKQRTIKDLEREIKQLSKQLGAEKLASLQTSYENMKSLLAQIESAINASDSDTAQSLDSDFWDANTDIWDIINEFHEIANNANQAKDIERNVKDKTRMIKDMTRECTKNKCESTEAGAKLKELESIFEQMQQVFQSGNYEGFWDLNGDFDSLSQDFWELNDQAHNTQDVQRWLKDISRNLKDTGRWVADLEREAKRGDAPFTVEEVAEAQSIYQQMEDAAKRAKEAYDKGDSQSAQDILSMELDDLRMQFEQITEGFNQRREENFFGFELERIKKELMDAENIIKKLLEENAISDEKATLCMGYVEQGNKYVAELTAIQDEGKIGENEELQARFEQLGNKADRDCGDVLGDMNKANYEDFTKNFVREDLQGMADELFNRMSSRLEDELMNRLLDRLGNHTEAINTMIEQAGEKWQQQLENAFESISFVDESHQDELFNHKNRLLEKIREMDEAIAAKSRELEALQEKIAGYNFYGDAGDEMEGELENFIAESAGLSESEIKDKIRELEKRAGESINKAREEKYQRGVIPFLDADDNEWFGRYVADVAEKGIVRGYTDANGNPTGKYEPGRPVSVAEILKMALEFADLGEAEGEPQQGGNHWARGYVKQAEDLGMTIVSSKVDLNRAATRGEVVRIIIEAIGLLPEEVSESSFADVSNDDPNLKYIEMAKQLGLVSGDGDKNTFRPNDPINRAETAKIISNSEKLLSE